MLGIGNSMCLSNQHPDLVDLKDVTQLQLWLKNGVGVAVGQWDDSSGKGRDVIQGTADNQAAVSGGGLDFEEGDGDHYDFSDTIDIGKNQGFCVAWVIETETGSNNTILSDGNAEAIQIQNGSKLRIYADDNSAVTTQLHVGSAFGTAKMAIVLNRTRLGVWSIMKNGAYLTIEADSGNSANADDGANIMGFTIDTVGVRNAVSGTYLDAKLYELAFWDRELSTTEILDVSTYLVRNHGL